ncbi:leucine-rich repeat-containing protein 24 [Culicoides brevitarsis]|uniref:leucine-rich repeat-containing protein 24 n=1 Tax=Culicoides brevitarsis TaxID=469753 RepID=UPI00307C1001
MSPPVKYLIKSIKFRNKTMYIGGGLKSWLLVFLAVSSCILQLAEASGSCPSMCTCKWKGGKETAECTDKSLISIPENIEPGTQVLDISNNNLQILPREIFRRSSLLNLQKIYLRDCRLGQIDRAAFAGLTNLVELDLSHNLLTSIPTASLNELPSLRDLILTSNSIQKIDERAFAPVPHLVKLDLSNCGIQTITPRAFEGLQALHTLKLNGNKLSDLRAKTIETLGKLRGIELHDNPWVCDCRLRAAKLWLTENNIPFTVAPVCAGGPERVIQHSFAELGVDDFACKPEILYQDRILNRIVEAGAGENATITCRAAGIPSPKISWFWNGRALMNNSMHNAHQRIHIYEFGVSEKRSTLVLTNAQETDSSEFYCVAENAAGSTEANFTLHVSLRAAGIRTLGEKQIAGLSAALVILILFILLITGFLLVRLRRIPISESKTPGQMEVITSVSPSNVIANGKVQCSSPVNRDDPSSPDHKDLKSGTNPIQKPPRLTDLPYSTNNYDGNGSVILPPISATGGFGSPTASGNNPDLINDTRVTGSGSNLAGIDTQLVANSQSTTIQMANLLAEMQLQHHQLQQASQVLLQQTSHLHPSESSSGDYSRAGGCDSLYPSGLWTGGSHDDPNLTNLLMNAHQMNGYTNSCYSTDKIMNNYQQQQQQQQDEELSSNTADYLSKTFPRTSLGSNNNSLLTNSYHHTLSGNGASNVGGGYPVDYGLPIVPGAETRNVVGGSSHNNNPMSNSTPPMNAKTLRVWQKGGVPVLPPVTALKRALTNSRNSPDEGYQEGCGTDV